MRLEIKGEYPPDWPAIADRVREEAGHRCIRCSHPYRVGAHGKGQWSPCDALCCHAGPLAFQFPTAPQIPVEDVTLTAAYVLREARGLVVAEWRILTVHHLDGNKSNCEWWNLLAICQRCHLRTQARVDPQTPYFLEHSPWFQPYVAGFYAHKYEGKLITREEAMQRLPELLAYELRA